MPADPPSAADVAADVDRVREALRAAEAPGDPGLPVDRLLHALDVLRPEVLAGFARAGLDRATAEETLADVPRKVAVYGTAPGTGIDAGWLLLLARADVVAVGRLQVERTAGPDGRAVHVPESGPLTAAAVDASFARSRVLFGPSAFTCTSWLLDPLLPPALGPDGGIVGFARRFAVGDVVRGEEHDRSVTRFVFHRPLADVLDPALVVPRTRLERCVAGHLRAGGHWSQPSATTGPETPV
ncbi:hypothetical protein [Kineococcus rubinsiae]|uniref:hypothetical protein n=1 Tax=Kineococcus rubinsiae TaxID=2609562 RepID=UPI001430B59A|nr:hypothetical protein [Kineococcus rubinsiae]NIZ91618.1 hypothetical protein [Kineococcus rubinsiae]